MTLTQDQQDALDEMAIEKIAEQRTRIADLEEGLRDLIEIIEAAGLLNLSKGVQLGPTSWYVKADERLQYAKVVLGAI